MLAAKSWTIIIKLSHKEKFCAGNSYELSRGPKIQIGGITFLITGKIPEPYPLQTIQFDICVVVKKVSLNLVGAIH